MSTNSSKTPKTYGFTLVEVLVIAPLVILVIGGFVGAIIAMTGDVLSTRGANKLVYDVHDALNRIETDVRQSAGFLYTNEIIIQSPQGENDDTDKFTADQSTLILKSYATDKNPIDNSHKVLIKNSNPLTAEIVYFVKDETLWRRVITPLDFEDDDGMTPWQQPSCTKNYNKSFCKANDMRLIDGVGSDGFSIEYIEHEGNSLDDLLVRLAKTIKITIKAKGGTAGREYSESGTVRATIPK